MSTNASFSSKSRAILRCMLPHVVAWSRMALLFIFLYNMALIFNVLAAAEIWRILMINEATVSIFKPSRIASCEV